MSCLSFWIIAVVVVGALWLVYEIYTAPHLADDDDEGFHF